MATNGIRFFDGAGNRIVVEYSTEVPPVAAATWTAVDEVRAISRNPEASPESSFSSYESTTEEIKLGLPRNGGWDFGAIFDPESVSQSAVLALDQSKGERWWRVTHPKADTTNGVASSFLFQGFVSVASTAYPDSDTADPLMFNWTTRQSAGGTFTPESAS